MAKFALWARTQRVGSTYSVEVEIPDEDLEDYEDADRDRVIEEWMNDELWNRCLIEWGWSEA